MIKHMFFIVSTVVIWYITTVIFGVLWSFLHMPYNPELSWAFNLVTLPFSLYLTWTGFYKKHVNSNAQLNSVLEGIDFERAVSSVVIEVGKWERSQGPESLIQHREGFWNAFNQYISKPEQDTAQALIDVAPEITATFHCCKFGYYK